MRSSPRLCGLLDKGGQLSAEMRKTPVYRRQGRFAQLPRFGPQSDGADPVPPSQLQALSARRPVAHSSSLCSWPVLVSPRQAFNARHLDLRPEHEKVQEQNYSPVGSRGRWAYGVLAASDQSRDAEPAPCNAQSADPRLPARQHLVLRLLSSGDALPQR